MKGIKTVLMMSVIFMLISCAPSLEKENESILVIENENESTTTYKFIYPDYQLVYWLIDERSIETGIVSLVENTIDLYWVTHDVEINLLAYEIIGDYIILDLSSSFNNSFEISDTAKAVNMQMLTNTICSNFQDIKSVQYIFDGENTEFIGDSLVNMMSYPNLKLNKVY